METLTEDRAGGKKATRAVTSSHSCFAHLILCHILKHRACFAITEVHPSLLCNAKNTEQSSPACFFCFLLTWKVLVIILKCSSSTKAAQMCLGQRPPALLCGSSRRPHSICSHFLSPACAEMIYALSRVFTRCTFLWLVRAKHTGGTGI